MMLIADSGSTKTDWALVTPGAVTTVSTQGLNPYQWDAEGMVGVLTEELLPQLRADEVDSVQFLWQRGHARDASQGGAGAAPGVPRIADA